MRTLCCVYSKDVTRNFCADNFKNLSDIHKSTNSFTPWAINSMIQGVYALYCQAWIATLKNTIIVGNSCEINMIKTMLLFD